MKVMKSIFFKYFLFYSICFIPLIILSDPIFMYFMLLFIIPYWIYLHNKHKISELDFKVIFTITIIAFVLSFICFLISDGSVYNSIWGLFKIWTFPFILIHFIIGLLHNYIDAIIFILVILTIQSLTFYISVKPQISRKLITVSLTLAIIISFGNYLFYQNRPDLKYKGHEFEYMNGYSSTDLSAYFPYSRSGKLITLSEKSDLIFENESDMPILDGAEACYPVYSAIAKATYKNIDKIEYDASNNPEYEFMNGKFVTFTNTAIGYERLFNQDIDMFFGAKPSKSQLELLKENNVELEYTPIGKEAFVFFVNVDNPVNNLTTEQVKKIYHGDIKNWKEVGGNDENITAFQRPERSGSQSMMVHFMGDVSLKKPLSLEMQTGMGGIINEVAQYNNESGAIGYTFKYFLEGLNQEKGVKILSIDNMKPTTDNIKNQSYPISTYLYCVTLNDNKKENVKKLKNYLLSDQGQYIIEQTGYCSLK